jgi:hypothetical protein
MATAGRKGSRTTLSIRLNNISKRYGSTRASMFGGSTKLAVEFPAKIAISTPGLDELDTFLMHFRQESINNVIPAGAMNKAVQGISAGIRDNFNRKQGPDGPWAPLKPSTARFRARQGYDPYAQDLVRGGSLKKALDQLDILAAQSTDSGAMQKFTGSVRPNPSLRKSARTRKDGKPSKRNRKMDTRYKTPPVTVDIQYGKNEISAKKVTKHAEVRITGASVALNNGYSYQTKGKTESVPARPFWYVSTFGINEAEKLIRDFLNGHMSKTVKPQIRKTMRSAKYLHELGRQENMSLVVARGMTRDQRREAFIKLFKAGLRGRGMIDERGKESSLSWKENKRMHQVIEPEDLLRVAGVLNLRRDIATKTFLHTSRDPIEHYLDRATGQVFHRYRWRATKNGKIQSEVIDITNPVTRRTEIEQYIKRMKSGQVITDRTSQQSETVSLMPILQKLGFPDKHERTGDSEITRNYYAKLRVTLLTLQMAEMKRMRSTGTRSERAGDAGPIKRSIDYLERHDIAGAFAFRINPSRISTAAGTELSHSRAMKSTIDDALEVIMGRKMTYDNELIAEALGRRGRDFGDALLAIRDKIQQDELKLRATAEENNRRLDEIDNIPMADRYDAFFSPDNQTIVSSDTGLTTTSRGAWSSRYSRHTMATRMMDFVPEASKSAVARTIQEMFGHWDQEFTGTYTRYGGMSGEYQIYEKNKYGEVVPVSTKRILSNRAFSQWEMDRNRLVWLKRTLRVMEYFAQRAWEEMYYRSVEIRIKHEMGMYYEALQFTRENTDLHPYATQAQRMLKDILKQISTEEDERDAHWSAVAGGVKMYGPRFMSRRRELGWLMNYQDFNNVFWDKYTYRMSSEQKLALLGPNGIGISERMTTPVEGKAYRDKNGQWYSVNRSQANWLQVLNGQVKWGLNTEQAVAAGLINKRGEFIEADVPVHIYAAAAVKEAAYSAWVQQRKNIQLADEFIQITDDDIYRDENGLVIGIKRGKYNAGGQEKRKSWWAGYARQAGQNPIMFSRSGYSIVPFNSRKLQQEASQSELSVRRKVYYDVFKDIINRYGWMVQEDLDEDPRKLLRKKGLGGYRVESYLYGRKATTRARAVLPKAYEEVKFHWGRDASGRLIASYSIEELSNLIYNQRLSPTMSRIAYMALVALYETKRAEAAEAADRERQGGGSSASVARSEAKKRTRRSSAKKR